MITRHFVSVGTRRVHYTRAGQGPALVLLHESPVSAKSLAVVQTVFAQRFTAIAIDTPGFGLSDPLMVEPLEISDLADALADTLTALGVTQVAVYGRHTGASIAVEFARRHPDRCTMAVADGYPLYSGPQRESRLTEYLKPLIPSWEGAHLLWLWFRYREQHVFWPWHGQTAGQRADTDVPDLDFLHRGVIELLEAGDGYRGAYAAAFRHGGQGLTPVEALRVPACFAAREGDSLFRTLATFPPGVCVQALPRDQQQAAVETMALLDRHPAPEPPPVPPVAPVPGRTTTFYVGQMLVRRAGETLPGTPLVVVPDIPGSSELIDPLVLALGQHCPVLAFDLPGQGESAVPEGFRLSITAWAISVLTALDRLGIARVALYGHGTGGIVAAAIARLAPERVEAAVLGAPPCGMEALANTYAQSATPEWDGSHLLRVWHHLRDQELWFPWFERTRATVRAGELNIEPGSLTLRARACLKHPALYQPAWQAVLSSDLPPLACPVTVVVAERDLFARCAAQAAAAVGGSVVPVTQELESRVSAILGCLPAG